MLSVGSRIMALKDMHVQLLVPVNMLGDMAKGINDPDGIRIANVLALRGRYYAEFSGWPFVITCSYDWKRRAEEEEPEGQQ